MASISKPLSKERSSTKGSAALVGIVSLVAAAVFLAVHFLGESAYFVIPAPTYLTVHNLLEFASITVSFSVFVINWIAYGQNKNRYSLFIAGGFLAVGLLDLMHLLSFNGMPDFVTPSSPEKAINYWIAARFWDATILAISAYILPGNKAKWINQPVILTLNLGLAAAVFILVTFFQESIPHTFIAGQGLTPLKIWLEYAIVGVLFLAIASYAFHYRKHAHDLPSFILSALVLAVFGELAFTLYINVYDSMNLLGHLFKIAAYALIFRALLVSSVLRPYDELKNLNAGLSEAIDVTRRRARELAILNDIAATVSQSLDLKKILGDMLDKVLDLLKVEAGMIILVDQETGDSRPEVWHGIPERMVNEFSRTPVKPNEGLMGLVISADGAIVGTSLSSDPRVVRETTRSSGLRGFVFTPIKAKNQQLGALLIASYGGRTFTSEEVELLENISNQAGMAVENALLFGRTDEQLQKKVSELAKAEKQASLLSDITVTLSQTLDLKETFSKLGLALLDNLGDFAAILVKEPDGTLSTPLVLHRDPEKRRKAQDYLQTHRFLIGEGVVGTVAKTGTGEFWPHVTTQDFLGIARPEQHQFYYDMDFHSYMAVPLVHGRETIGALALGITESGLEFTTSDYELAEEIGHRAAVAIANANLYQQASEERRRLQSIIDQLPEGVIITGASLGTVLIANKAAENMGGSIWVDGQSNHHARISKTSGEDCATGELPAFRALYKGEFVRGEQFALNSNGDSITVLVNAAPLFDDNDTINGAVVVFQDITEIKNLERAKDEFISIASHDIKSPITSIKGYAQLAKRRLEKGDHGKLSEHLEAIDRQSDYIAQLVDTLLDVSRIQVGTLAIKREKIDLAAMVRELAEHIRVTSADHSVEVSANEPAIGEWDSGRLSQVISNLLGNAVKYSPPGALARITVANEGDSVHVWVQDEGIGIAESEIQHVFDRFFRASTAEKSSVRGTGLGLYISKAIVEAHGGQIWAESREGRGSTFHIRLPKG